MCRPPSSGRVRRRACGLPYPTSGRRSRPSVALHVCFLTGAPRHPPETRPLLAVSRAHPSCVQRRPTEGGSDSPARHPGADGRCASPVTLPHIPPAVLGVPLPTMFIVCRRRWGPVIGRERRRIRPVIAPPPFAPPPAIQLRSRR